MKRLNFDNYVIDYCSLLVQDTSAKTFDIAWCDVNISLNALAIDGYRYE